MEIDIFKSTLLEAFLTLNKNIRSFFQPYPNSNREGMPYCKNLTVIIGAEPLTPN